MKEQPPNSPPLRRRDDLRAVEQGMHAINRGEPMLPNRSHKEGAPLVERKINNPTNGVFAVVDGSPSSPGRAAIVALTTVERLALELGNRLDQDLEKLSLAPDVGRRRAQTEEQVANHIRMTLKSMNGILANNNRNRGGGPDRATVVAAKLFEVAPGERRLALANLGAHRAYLLEEKSLRRLTQDDREPAGREHQGAITEFIGEGEKANDMPVQFMDVKTGDKLLLISEDVAHVPEDELHEALLAYRRASDAERAIQDKANTLSRDPRHTSEHSGGFAAVVYEVPAAKERHFRPSDSEHSPARQEQERWREAIPATEARIRETDKHLEARLRESKHAKDWTPEHRRLRERLIAETRREHAELGLALADLKVKRARSIIPPRFRGSETVTVKGERPHETTVRSFDATTDEYVVAGKGLDERIPRFQLEAWQRPMDLPLQFGDRFVLADGIHPEGEVRYIGLDTGRSAVQLQWPDGKMGWTTILNAHEAVQQEILDAREAQLEKVTQQKIIDTVTKKAA